MKEFKTPRVSKDIVGSLLTAFIAECLYTDTFYTGDRKFPLAQVFVDRVSRYGDVVPMRSRTEVGSALVTFVCRHFTPLTLISDNISENHGGDLVEQCRKRDIKHLDTCPYHPQMDFAEGYIGRITTMASFAMVYSGAPPVHVGMGSEDGSFCGPHYGILLQRSTSLGVTLRTGARRTFSRCVDHCSFWMRSVGIITKSRTSEVQISMCPYDFRPLRGRSSTLHLRCLLAHDKARPYASGLHLPYQVISYEDCSCLIRDESGWRTPRTNAFPLWNS